LTNTAAKGIVNITFKKLLLSYHLFQGANVKNKIIYIMSAFILIAHGSTYSMNPFFRSNNFGAPIPHTDSNDTMDIDSDDDMDIDNDIEMGNIFNEPTLENQPFNPYYISNLPYQRLSVTNYNNTLPSHQPYRNQALYQRYMQLQKEVADGFEYEYAHKDHTNDLKWLNQKFVQYTTIVEQFNSTYNELEEKNYGNRSKFSNTDRLKKKKFKTIIKSLLKKYTHGKHCSQLHDWDTFDQLLFQLAKLKINQKIYDRKKHNLQQLERLTQNRNMKIKLKISKTKKLDHFDTILKAIAKDIMNPFKKKLDAKLQEISHIQMQLGYTKPTQARMPRDDNKILFLKHKYHHELSRAQNSAPNMPPLYRTTQEYEKNTGMEYNLKNNDFEPFKSKYEFPFEASNKKRINYKEAYLFPEEKAYKKQAKYSYS